MKRFFFLLLVLIMTDSVVSGHSLITSDSTKTTAIEKRILTEEEFRAEYRKILLDLELFSLKSDMYCCKICDIWNGAIYDDNYKYNGKYVKDFNEAIELYQLDRLKEDTYYEYKKYSEEIKKAIKSINKHPQQCQIAFDELLQLGILADELYNYAISPSGSYKSYSTETKELYKQIRRKLYELEMKYTD